MNKNDPNENQVINDNKSSDETLPSNVNPVSNDQNNQDMFKDWVWGKNMNYIFFCFCSFFGEDFLMSLN